jgi:hypothetical protein
MLVLKKMTAFVLLIIAAGSFICAAEASAPEAQSGAAPAYIKAYYFHGNFRCASCTRIEEYSKNAIEGFFGDKLKNGTLVFESVNVDKPENKHFIQDYKLYTRSLVIAAHKDGKQITWKNLDRVWQLLRNETAFGEYVKKEIDQLYKEL